MFAVKCERFLHVKIPVGPIVAAGEFLVFVGDAERVEF